MVQETQIPLPRIADPARMRHVFEPAPTTYGSSKIGPIIILSMPRIGAPSAEDIGTENTWWPTWTILRTGNSTTTSHTTRSHIVPVPTYQEASHSPPPNNKQQQQTLNETMPPPKPGRCCFSSRRPLKSLLTCCFVMISGVHLIPAQAPVTSFYQSVLCPKRR